MMRWAIVAGAAIGGALLGVVEHILRRNRERAHTRAQVLLSGVRDDLARYERAEWMGTRDE